MKTTLSMLGGIGAQELIAVLITFLIFSLIFLSIRAIILWYWKIDTIVKNQQRQIELLEELTKQYYEKVN